MSETTEPPMPSEVWAPAPCPRCGARTAVESETLCRPERDQTGEGTCPADREDEAGNLLQPTAASHAAIDEWIVRYARD